MPLTTAERCPTTYHVVDYGSVDRWGVHECAGPCDGPEDGRCLGMGFSREDACRAARALTEAGLKGLDRIAVRPGGVEYERCTLGFVPWTQDEEAGR
jgi:hypothetical protein